MRKYSRFTISFQSATPLIPSSLNFELSQKEEKHSLPTAKHSFNFLPVTHFFENWQLSLPTKSCLLLFFSGIRECSAGSRRLHRTRFMAFYFLYLLCHLSTSFVLNSVLHFVFVIGTASRDTTQHDAPSFLAWRLWFLFSKRRSSIHVTNVGT